MPPSAGATASDAGSEARCASVLHNDVVAESQADVDALAGVRRITGMLRIAGLAQRPHALVATGITSLAALRCLETVGSALIVADHRNLSELTGLQHLTRVGRLSIQANPMLSSLEGLNALKVANGVEVIGNAALTSLDALAGLTIVRDTVMVDSNDALTDLHGLHNLTAVGGLLIDGNSSLTKLSALSALTVVGGSLEIRSTPLTNLMGLEGVAFVGSNLVVFSNGSLTSLAGLDNVTRVGSSVRIGYNPVLPNLDRLDRLARIGKDEASTEDGLAIYANSQLSSLAGLDGLQSVVGRLWIYGNTELSRCDAEALATRLGTTCTSTIDPWPCTDVCTCGGNRNDVACGD